MKKQEETRKPEQQTEKKAVYVAASINTCIACGREIPEGMLVCMECEVGESEKKCMICNSLMAEGDCICPNCKAIIFRSR